jgi:hypothetical protein
MSAPTCSFCKQEGHIRRDCELYDTVAPDIDAFIKLSSNAPSRTPFDAPNSILTALIVLVSLLSPSLLSTLLNRKGL